MNATLRIKNLSIALEALSRINTSRSHEHSQDIEGLLAQEIYSFRREKEKENQWPQRSAKPITDEDNIPF